MSWSSQKWTVTGLEPSVAQCEPLNTQSLESTLREASSEEGVGSACAGCASACVMGGRWLDRAEGMFGGCK